MDLEICFFSVFSPKFCVLFDGVFKNNDFERRGRIGKRPGPKMYRVLNKILLKSNDFARRGRLGGRPRCLRETPSPPSLPPPPCAAALLALALSLNASILSILLKSRLNSPSPTLEVDATAVKSRPGQLRLEKEL